MLIAALVLLSTPCTATDGDTIRCGSERIRLLGIDSPELPGHCRAPRVCVLGDPWQAKANMMRLLRRQPLTIRRIGQDRYHRTLALVSAGGVDLSCAQVTSGNAVYVEKWDNGHSLRSICPEAAPR